MIRISAALFLLCGTVTAQTVEAILHVRDRAEFTPLVGAAVSLNVRGAWLPAQTADATGRVFFSGAFELPAGEKYPWIARDAAGRVSSGAFEILPKPAGCRSLKRSTSFTLLIPAKPQGPAVVGEENGGDAQTKTDLLSTRMLACGSDGAPRRFSTVYQNGTTAVTSEHDATKKTTVRFAANISVEAKSKIELILSADVEANAGASSEQSAEVEVTRKWNVAASYPGRCGRLSVHDDVLEMTWASYSRQCKVLQGRHTCGPWVQTATWTTTITTGVCVLDETVSCSTVR